MEKSLIKGPRGKYLRHVEIYIGGSCHGNPGPGGYAAILVCNKAKRKIFGNEQYTTSNRMKMTAATESLKSLKHSSVVTVYSDSEMITKGMNEWLESWKKKGWINKKGRPVANIDLWKSLEEAIKRHHVTFLRTKKALRTPDHKQAQKMSEEEMNKIIESYR